MTYVKRPHQKPREKAWRVRVGRVVFLVLCVTISAFLLLHTPQEMADRHEIYAAGKGTADAHEHLLSKVGVLEHEGLFHQTIKSCLPELNKKCNLYIPEGTTAHRVAVMAPPGDFGVNFHRLLQGIVVHARRTQQIELEIIPTNHVPPYGYGKTQ
jgi:hypothetical protein